MLRPIEAGISLSATITLLATALSPGTTEPRALLPDLDLTVMAVLGRKTILARISIVPLH